MDNNDFEEALLAKMLSDAIPANMALKLQPVQEQQRVQEAFRLLDMSHGYVDDEDSSAEGAYHDAEEEATGSAASMAFLSMTSSEVVEMARRSLKGMDECIRWVATMIQFAGVRYAQICAGVSRDTLPPLRFLHISGESGSGKTAVVRTTASCLGVHMIESSVASLTGEGWSGTNPSSMLGEAARYQKEHPGEMIVMFFDECDKFCRDRSTENKSTFNPLISLLSVLDSDGTYMFTVDKSAEITELDTDAVVFVFAGCYDGIHEIVRQRLRAQGREDAEKLYEHELRSMAAAEDFIEYGQSPEFMGRAGVLVNVPRPAKDAMYDVVMDSDMGLARRYDDMIGRRGAFTISAGAASVLAIEASRSKMGVRRAQSMLAPLGAQAVVESLSWDEPMEACVRWDAQTGGLYLDEQPLDVEERSE